MNMSSNGSSGGSWTFFNGMFHGQLCPTGSQVLWRLQPRVWLCSQPLCRYPFPVPARRPDKQVLGTAAKVCLQEQNPVVLLCCSPETKVDMYVLW